MTIDKKLIHFKDWSTFISPDGVNGNWETPNPGTFEEDGTAIYGQIRGTSIVFIKDVGKIWTHGRLYNDDNGAVDFGYAVCNSAADSNLKVIELEGYTYTEGSRLVIRLNNGSTVSPSALQVNNSTTGIQYCSNPLPPGTTFPTAHILELTYGSGVWNITGGYQRNDYINGIKSTSTSTSNSITNYCVCDSAWDDPNKVVTINADFSLVVGAQVVVCFQNGNTISDPTLNVNNTGSIALMSGKYSTDTISSGTIVTCVYAGGVWKIMSSDQIVTNTRIINTSDEIIDKTDSVIVYTFEGEGSITLQYPDDGQHITLLKTNTNPLLIKTLSPMNAICSNSNWLGESSVTITNSGGYQLYGVNNNWYLI